MYDDNKPRSQLFSSESSQPPSTGYRRDSGPARNASWSGDAFTSSPDTLLRGRSPRHPTQYHNSRSRSRSISRKASPNVLSSKALSGANRNARQRDFGRYRSRSYSRSRSRSRSRSLSSSDVASTRASERSSRGPSQKPSQQALQTNPPPKPAHEAVTTEPSVKQDILPQSHPSPVVQQKKPLDNSATAVSEPQQRVPVSISAVQRSGSTDQPGGPGANTRQHKPAVPAPKLAVETNLPGGTVHERAEPGSSITSTPNGRFTLIHPNPN